MDENLISFIEPLKIKSNNIAKVFHWTVDIFLNAVMKNLCRYVIFANSTPFMDESIISTVFYQLPLELMFDYDSDILLDPEVTIICFIDKIGHDFILLSDVKIYSVKDEELTEYKINPDCAKCLLIVLPKPFSDDMIPRLSLLVSTGEISEKVLKHFSKKVKDQNSIKYESFNKNVLSVYEQSKLPKVRYLRRKLFKYFVLPNQSNSDNMILNIDMFILGNKKQCREYILNLLIVYINEIKNNIDDDRLEEILTENVNIIKQMEYTDISSYLLIYYKTNKITETWKKRIIKDCDNLITSLQKVKN